MFIRWEGGGSKKRNGANKAVIEIRSLHPPDLAILPTAPVATTVSGTVVMVLVPSSCSIRTETWWIVSTRKTLVVNTASTEGDRDDGYPKRSDQSAPSALNAVPFGVGVGPFAGPEGKGTLSSETRRTP